MASTARLSVLHETRYAYSTRVDLAYHLACLHPRPLAYQRVGDFALEIAPTPTHWQRHEDAFGNLRDCFSFYQAHDALEVRMHCEVDLLERHLASRLADTTSWETVRDAMRYRADSPWNVAAEFVFPSPFAPVEPALRAYAAQEFTPGRPLVAAALALTQRMHAEFAFDPKSTEVGTPALEAFRQRRGVCQDFSHIMIGCLRSLGLPARYMSGYLLTHPAPGQARRVGADASHAWVAVWSPVAGWLDLDPTNGIAVDREHITIGWGRDYRDVPPLAGVIQGGGAHTLEVAVTVTPQAHVTD